jgi:diguanylate cyclase (GGDEF)-like protein
MFDIDHFKVVNDTYGHDIGDRVLVEVVQSAMETIRQSDVLARWGGEEFMVLLPQTTPEMALSMAQRLLENINGYEFTGIGTLSVSIGVVHLQQADTIDLLVKRVDDALYAAKESGRNRVVAG